jgi:nucleoside-diphosphate-sugar epimerase
MNIILTGSSGFIGNILYKQFSKNHKVYQIDYIASEETSDFFNIDLTKPKEIISYFENIDLNNIDLVIHCASILANNKNFKDINLLYNNLKITESLIEIIKLVRPNKLLNFSTIGVYPNKDGYYNEKSEIKPSDNFEALYGLSKFNSEELFNFYLKETNTNVINLRIAQTIGEGMRNDRIYSVMLSELNKTNKITVWGNGERISSFVSIDYLMYVIRILVDKNNIEGTFNIGEKNMSYLQLAKDIIELHGNNESEIILIEKGVRSKNYLDFNKINELIK